MDVVVQRLGPDGRPEGEPLPVASVHLVMTRGPTPDMVESIRVATQAHYDLALTLHQTVKQLKRLQRLFYPDRRAYLRARHYFNRGHKHAPRRRNKHGRTGVRR